MKTKIKILGLIFTVIAMTAFIAACSNPAGIDDNWYLPGGDGDGDGGGGGGGEDVTETPPIGHNLTLKGQVWYLDDDTKNYFHFMGDRADIKAYVNGGYVASEPNGTGTITGGQLNFNIGIPTVLLPSDEMKTALQDAVISPAETQFNVFFYLIAERNEMPTLYSVASSGTPDVELTEVFGCVIFLYVDQDATMSSAGSEWFDDTCSYGNTFLVKYEPYTINLHEGWNIITVREDRVTRPANYISTYSVSLGSPADAEWRMCLGVPPPKPFLQM